MLLTTFFIVMTAYLLGSIPFGLILTRMAGLGDIRTIGSGNIGATNVLRTGNKGVAALTLLLDGGKGTLAVALALAAHPTLAPWAGVAALLGHIFPLWLKFKGGKGVATAFGITLILAWPVGVCSLLLWIGIMKITRMSSAGGITAIASLPLLAAGLGYHDLTLPLVLTALIVVAKHHENIRRILNGTESRFGKNKKTHIPSESDAPVAPPHA